MKTIVCRSQVITWAIAARAEPDPEPSGRVFYARTETACLSLGQEQTLRPQNRELQGDESYSGGPVGLQTEVVK